MTLAILVLMIPLCYWEYQIIKSYVLTHRYEA